MRELGYAVLEAGAGSDALAILDEEGVDLLLTDVVLPDGVNGRMLADRRCTVAPA